MVLVDIFVLTKDDQPIDSRVAAGIRNQVGIRLRLNQIVAKPRANEANRIATIARGRNMACDRVKAPWVMFVDDDVLLQANCVAGLVDFLQRNPAYGAAASDYLKESHASSRTDHVGMGATLFRAEVLKSITFRSSVNHCECSNCCRDLRANGIGIGYVDGSESLHISRDRSSTHHTSTKPTTEPIIDTSDALILAAFDRRDADRFRLQFVRSLREWGNQNHIVAVAYGLYPSERHRLSQLPNVEVISAPENGRMPPVRRLTDFAKILRHVDNSRCVAYWDVGDVVFQASLEPLWRSVADHPAKLLAVREPRSYPHNKAVVGWTRTIHEPSSRAIVFKLLANSPFLNSGFAAGTAGRMKDYFETAAALRDSHVLRGTLDWGDQTALNYYCHSAPEGWQEVDQCWNFCIHDRRPGDIQVTTEGLVRHRDKLPICVVHGNARSLRQFALSTLCRD